MINLSVQSETTKVYARGFEHLQNAIEHNESNGMRTCSSAHKQHGKIDRYLLTLHYLKGICRLNTLHKNSSKTQCAQTTKVCVRAFEHLQNAIEHNESNGMRT